MTSELTSTTAKTDRLGALLALVRRLWWWAPLLFAAAYLVTLALQFNQLLADTYLNADAASGPVIGQLFGARTGHPLVILGHLGWYSTLLFELGTRWLPLHRQIWEVSPYAMALCSAALVGWGAWRVAGRWAGAIAAAILICASPGTLTLLLALNDHAPTWFTIALLGAFVVLLEQRAGSLPVLWLAALAVLVGLILGANAASDILLTIAGAVPFLLAVGGTWAIHPGRRTARAAVFALASCVVAVASSVLVHALMRHENVVSASDANTKLLVGAEAVGTNFKLWWQSIAVLGNGNFFGRMFGFSSALAFACAALTIAGVILAVRLVRGELVQALVARRRRSHGHEQEHERDPEQSMRLAWCLFWGSSLVLLSTAFVFSGIPEGLQSSRYLVGVIYAAAALVPLLGARSVLTRGVLTVAVTLFAFTGWLSLAQHTIVAPASPTDQLAGAVEKIATKEHLSVGYAGYWDAAPITWATHLGVEVFPVDDCDGGLHLCAFELHLITSWYTPRPRTKTFLLSDPAYPQVPSTPTPDLGKPIAVHQIGTVTMYVYSYDIAARLFAL
jgi:hypothetical protein